LLNLLNAPREVYREKSAELLAYIAKELADYLDWTDKTWRHCEGAPSLVLEFLAQKEPVWVSLRSKEKCK
jgi:hypothetical protein